MTNKRLFDKVIVDQAIDHLKKEGHMTNHTSPETVYIEYQTRRNYVHIWALENGIDYESKNIILAFLMYEAMKKIGVDKFIELNTIEATDDNMYQGVSL